MAITGYKKDNIFRGTALSIDINELSGNRGTIRAIVEGNADDVDDLAAAVDFILTNAPSQFPNTNIPLRGCQVRPYLNLGTLFEVIVVYQFDIIRYSGAGVSQVDIAEYATGHVAIPWLERGDSFDASGRPNGVDNTNAAGENQTYTRLVPVVNMRIPFYLTANPLGTVSSRLGRTNSDNMTGAGFVFAPNTLRFNGVTVRWLQEYPSGASRFGGHYDFTARADTWVRQFDDTDTTGSPPYEDMYERVTFTGAFPA